ncbi:MAG: hypothetical protein U0271_15060 [Polyangiaceae bacterium]
MKSYALLMAPLTIAAVFAACSSNKGPDNQADTSAEPSASAASSTQTQPSATASTTASAEPTTTASASSQPSTPPPSGRTPMTFEGKEKISEGVAEPPAKFKLTGDGARFILPEYALRDNYLVTFMVDKKPPAKAKGGAGSAYRLQAQSPPAETFIAITTAGPKFEIRLPLGKLTTANLAVGEVKTNDKGKEVVEWKIIAPKKTEDGLAVFEVEGFQNTLLQLTSEAPPAS